MAIEDRWFRAERGPDGKRTGAKVPVPNADQRKRWRVRWHGEDKSFDDIPRKKASPDDRPPKEVEIFWAHLITSKPKAKTADVLVGDLLDRWLATKKGLSARGYRACLDASAHVRREWGGHVAGDITREQVQVWIAGLDWSASMKHKLLQALSGAFALTDLPNPVTGVKTPKEKRREARWLTPDELEKLAVECQGYEVLVRVLGTTGLRIGEACALNVGDVDKKRGRLRVRESKSGRGRDVPIPAKLLAQLDLKRPKSEPLFTSRDGTRVLKDNFRARHFVPAAKRAGFEGLRIHDLRHAAASLAISVGADVKSVQNMLGHADANMTLNVYTERWDKGLDEVARRMDELLI